jgi:hypothetical protein
MTYFTNFKQGNLKITPQLGVGMGGFRAVAGYNIPTFFNKDFAGLRYSAGQISISYLLPIKTIKDDRVRCNY